VISTTDLKLAPFPTRSPLPLAALPSVSLLPAAPLTDFTDVVGRSPRRTPTVLLRSVSSA